MNSLLINKNFKLIASNTFFQLVTKFFTMIITFGLSIFISLRYGAESYGFFSLLQSLPAIFYIFADFGLNAVSVREMSKSSKKVEEIFSNVIFFRLFISIIGVLFCLSLSYFLYQDPTIRYGLSLASLIIITQSLIMTTNIIFQLKFRYDLTALSNLVGYLFILIFSIILINYSVSVIYLNFLYIVGGLISVIINFFLIYKYFLIKSFKVDRSYLKYLGYETWPLGLMFLFSQINFRADSILLSVLKLPSSFGNNLQALGIYSFPYKIFEVLLVIPTFIMNSVYPVLLDKFNQNKNIFQKFFKKTFLYFLGIGITVQIIMLSFIYIAQSFNLINEYFNPEFSPSLEVLRILSIGLVFYFLTQPLSWVFVIHGKQKNLPLIYLLASVFNVSLNYILIPSYGFYASAYITWVSELLILCLLFITAKKNKWI